MSMPKFPEPNPDFTQEQALTMILSSIALEEAALAHIMNAEGEKIQYVLKQCRCGEYAANYNHVVDVNKSVANLLEMVQQNQTILKNKMEKVLEHLPKSARPPKQPRPPRPPISECEPPGKMPACFRLIPKFYHCTEKLLWSEKNICCDTVASSCPFPRIQLPAAGSLLLSFYAETAGAVAYPDMLELVITCQGTKPIRIKIAPNKWPCKPGFFKQTVIEMPCSCSPCYAQVFVRASQGMRINKGGFFFTRFQADPPTTCPQWA